MRVISKRKSNVLYEDNHKFIENIEHKKCRECNQWIPMNSDYFYKNKSSKADGYNSYCIACTKIRTITWRKDNPDKRKVLYSKLNSTSKHKKASNNSNKKWRAKGGLKRWQQNNHDKVRGYNIKRNMNKRHEITKEEWLECKEYFNYECAYCGLSEQEHKRLYKQQLHKEHVDHEGSNGIDNCVPACKGCNGSKHTHSIDEWYSRQEFYDADKLYKIIKWLDMQINK